MAKHQKKRRKTEETPTRKRITFRDVLESLEKYEPVKFTPGIYPATLAHLPYRKELALKNEALRKFWQFTRLPGRASRTLAAPQPREYLSTSNRRIFERGGHFFLYSPEKKDVKEKRFFQPSSLENANYRAVYEFLAEKINQPAYVKFARMLNFITVRGGDSGIAVVLNMTKLDSSVVRKMKNLGSQLVGMDKNVVAFYASPLQLRTGHYLGISRPTGQLRFKTITGLDKMLLETATQKFRYPPMLYSPLNEAMVPVMINSLKNLMQPQPQEKLIDIFCGYGLWSHSLAGNFAEVLGIDIDGLWVDAANANFGPGSSRKRVRFISRRLKSSNLEEALLSKTKRNETVLLSQFPGNLPPGLLKTLAGRGPEKVLHFFHDINDMPSRLGEWRSNGYRFSKIVPVDALPGVSILKAFALLEKLS